MVALAHPSHFENLISNVKEVDRLLDIHTQITGPGPGRKHAVQVLNKSGIVLLVACWEAFVEDLALNALLFMIDNANDHTIFPDDVLDRIANKLHGKNAWRLAGSGWKDAVKDHLREVLARTTGALNTPKAQQVDELFEKTLGLKNVSSKWGWPGRSADVSKRGLNDLVALRGSIAHRVEASKSVRKKDVVVARNFVSRLAVKTHNAVNVHVSRRTGKKAWEGYWFDQTS